MTQLDGVTFTIVAKSGRSIPYIYGFMPSRARNGWKIHIYQVFTVRVKVRDLRKSSAYSSADIFPPQSPS